MITRAITGPSGIPAEQVHTPDPDRADLGETCADDDRLVSKAGIDLQLLGVGANGHNAFNERGTPRVP